VWPAVVMLAMYWTFLYVHYTYELAMFSRFISRVVVSGVLLIAFLGWWLTRRQIAARDRWLAVGTLILASIAAGLLADSSINPFILFLTAFPIVFTAWTLWLLVTRHSTSAMQRIGLVALTVVATGVFALLRWEGLYGNQVPQFSWRWSPTAEELFLATHDDDARATAAPREWTLQPGDWPEFRGPNRDGVVSVGTINADWQTNPPVQLWRQRVGPAWSSMIIVDGFLVTQEQRGDREAVVCYDAATGKELWAQTHDARFFEALAGAGPRSTPTFADGCVYTLGAKGQLSCIAASNGDLLWSRDVMHDAGGNPPQWGYSVSPLVVDGLVIAYGGGEGDQALLAYRADTGEPAWSRAGGTYTYSSPQLISIHGKKQILMHDDHSLVSVNPADGAVLWERANRTQMAMPIPQPRLVMENELLIQSDPGIGRLQVHRDVDEWTTEERWTSNRLKPSFNDFVVHQRHIYGLDDGILTCVDLEGGTRIWKRGRYGHGQLLLLADQGLLLVLAENGEAVLASASPDGHEELGRFQAIEGKSWNHPVISHGRLYVRNAEEMAAYDLQ
jgi:outer membrane protein assembly factor BamB